MFQKYSHRVCACLLALLFVLTLAHAESDSAPAATPAPSDMAAPLVTLPMATLPPEEGDIGREEAVERARRLLNGELGIDPRLTEKADFLLRPGLDAESPRVAVVTFTSSDSGSTFTVTLNGRTGQPLMASEYDTSCLTTLLYEYDPTLENSTAEPADQASFFPYTAFVANPSGKAAHVTQMPTDYDVPVGVYMNGTPVIVTGMTTLDGSSDGAPDGAQTQWAQVTIGMQGDFAGVTGYIPASLLDDSVGTGAIYGLPPARLTTSNPTQHLSLYKSSNRASDILGVYREGTTVQVMGRLRDWYHVRLGSLTGFVEVGSVAFDKDTEAAMQALVPDVFDSVQPGVEARYQKYMTAVDELWYKFGDSNDWPLNIKAQYSQLSLDWGFPEETVNILPGKDDLTQAQAESLALAAVTEKYGMTDRDYAKVSVRYAYGPEAPQEPEWMFRFYSISQDMPDCAVSLSRKGEVLSLWQDDSRSKASAYDPLSDLYLYQEGAEAKETAADISRARAEEIAGRVYAEQTGEEPADAVVTSSLRANDTMRWWYISFGRPGMHEHVRFDVVVLSPEGPVAAHTAREQYESALAQYAEPFSDLDALEKEKGRLFTWSLEDKQAYAPDLWGLPGPNDITQEQALAIATKCLKDKYGMTDEELARWHPFYMFDITGTPQWSLQFYTDEIIASSDLTGYSVSIDARTGEVLQCWAPEEQNG